MLKNMQHYLSQKTLLQLKKILNFKHNSYFELKLNCIKLPKLKNNYSDPI